MLKKENISLSKLDKDKWEYKGEWKKARLGKFTSSKIYLLCGERGLGEGGLSYIKDKVGEDLTGEPADPEIDTEATRHGLMYESEAIDKFGQVMGLQFVVVQQLISVPRSRFGSTPDGLSLIRESLDKTEWQVETAEAKCPPTFKSFIGLSLCETPQDVKEENKAYYWQVLDQMDSCGSIKGYLIIYNPKFRFGNLTIITFDALQSFIDGKGNKVYPINNDLKLLRERKKLGEEKFYEIRDKMISKGHF